ncbi:uncharacterized protein K489DRAFT_270285 [Dissoconium aciculare CBS 342.82]|uniref:Uncharacterized protein n=1 Tax=Dissoconium aciculare CBS 342.82 TaxID=1314786 RepID=A0A6J3LZN4_9PEZI|nr:uncharacterized protein K489DRAFT_270285 [Dissoconium aciculare CBS 342.82]KAF1821255.1 hypothetical protein K489DRAFT_270285 [Dissoconium aciculare CBS 342.82]
MATSEISVTTEHDEPRPEEPRRNAYHRNKDHRLRRLLTMETSLAKNIHKCNPQTDSPIWRLPQEIRDMVCGSTFSLSSGLLSRFLI